MFKLKFEELFFNDKVTTLLEVLKISLILFFLVHWTGCIFYFMADIEMSITKQLKYFRIRLSELDWVFLDVEWAFSYKSLCYFCIMGFDNSDHSWLWRSLSNLKLREDLCHYLHDCSLWFLCLPSGFNICNHRQHILISWRI